MWARADLHIHYIQWYLASLGFCRCSPERRRMRSPGIAIGDPIGERASLHATVGRLIHVYRFVFERALQTVSENVPNNPASATNEILLATSRIPSLRPPVTAFQRPDPHARQEGKSVGPLFDTVFVSSNRTFSSAERRRYLRSHWPASKHGPMPYDLAPAAPSCKT